MSLLDGYGEGVVVSLFVMLTMAFFSLLATITTLWLIRAVGRKNGYTTIIIWLTSTQLVYDFSVLIFPTESLGTGAAAFTDMLSTYSGISTSLWSNVLSYVVYYVVANFRAINIEKNFVWFLLGVNTPALAVALGVMVSYIHSDPSNTATTMYLVIRMVSILANFLLYYLVARKIAQMDFNSNNKQQASNEADESASNHSGSTKRRDGNNNENPVHALSRRLKYYPVFQAISRVPVTWYQLAYGSIASTGKDFRPERNALLIVSAVVTPAAGLAYFAIYLLMQPLAYAYFKSSLLTCCSYLCSKKMTTEEREDLFRQTFVANAAAAKRDAADVQFDQSASNAVHTLMDDLDEEELALRIEKMGAEQQQQEQEEQQRTSSSIDSRPSLFDSNIRASSEASVSDDSAKSLPMTSRLVI